MGRKIITWGATQQAFELLRASVPHGDIPSI
jgi:hypothetical protein